MLRLRLGLTQTAFAEKIGVKGGVISAWEKGAARVPLGRIFIICRAYDVREEWLREGRGEIFNAPPVPPAPTDSDAKENFFRYVDRMPDELIKLGVAYCREFLKRYDVEYIDVNDLDDDLEEE